MKQITRTILQLLVYTMSQMQQFQIHEYGFGYSWMLEQTVEVNYSNDEIMTIINLFAECNIQTYVRSFIEMHRHTFYNNSWKFKVAGVRNICEMLDEVRITCNEIYNVEFFNKMSIPYEKFKDLIALNIKFLYAEILFTKQFSTPWRITELIRREIDTLNGYKYQSIEKLTKEKYDTIFSDIQHFKREIGKIAMKQEIYLPDDLAYEVFRHEQIFKILTFMEQIEDEDEVTANVKQIMQNKDLGRYLMGFI